MKNFMRDWADKTYLTQSQRVELTVQMIVGAVVIAALLAWLRWLP